MDIKFIDIHSHLGFADYGKDLGEVIKRMEESGVATIAVGANLSSSKEAVKVAEMNKNIWACIGIHPTERESFEESDFEELIKNPKVVAIGECGLEYFKLTGDVEKEKERQKKEFIKHIEFAIKYNKPLMLHIRDGAEVSGGRTLGIEKGPTSGNCQISAYSDAYEILFIYKEKVKGNIHFFAANLEWAKKFIDLGFTPTPTLASRCFAVIKSAYTKLLPSFLKRETGLSQRKTMPKLVSGFTISFTGVITFPPKADQPRADAVGIIRSIPLDKIHAETDAPYVAPVPYRGKRNEPTYVVEVVKKIAEIRGEDFEVVRKQLLENAKRTFGLRF